MSALRMLLPGEAIVGDLDADRGAALQSLADLYAYPDPVPATGWVRATMVSSPDGAAAGADGRSGSVSSPADRALFGVLRGLADVVLVAARTVRAERYRLPVPRSEFADRRRRAGQRPAPVLAVVTRTALPRDLPWLVDDPASSLVVVPESADVTRWRHALGHDRVLVSGRQDVDPHEVVDGLVARGLGRILLEGGPGWLGQVLGASRVDEFCLTITTRLVAGDGPRVAVGPPVDIPVRPVHLVECEGTLLGRWLVQRR